MTTILTGDVGGTKTTFALFDAEGQKVAAATYASADFDTLEAAAHHFLKAHPASVDAAVFDVAGPVEAGQARLTNLGWETSEVSLRHTLHLERVALLNDLVAIAAAVPHLRADEIEILQAGRPDPHGTIAVVAPGTGLGEAYLTWDAGAGRHVPHPSEGGHTDFAPRNEEEIALLRYLWQRYPHVSYERITSGMGLQMLYTFAKEHLGLEEPPWIESQIAEVTDPNPIIVTAALEHKQRPCPPCRKALDLFLSLLGAEAGNMALKVLARGGLYLAGGIPPRILPALQEGPFLRAFIDKGRMRSLLATIPVYVVLRPDAPLLGDFHYALDRWALGAISGGMEPQSGERGKSPCSEPMTKAMQRGIALFNAGRYFEAHEVWEDYWREEARPVRLLYQTLIQLAGAFIQHRRAKPVGARWLLKRALLHTEHLSDCCHGVDVAALRRLMMTMQAELKAEEPPTPFVIPRCSS